MNAEKKRRQMFLLEEKGMLRVEWKDQAKCQSGLPSLALHAGVNPCNQD